jgi:hypothetical protein
MRRLVSTLAVLGLTAVTAPAGADAARAVPLRATLTSCETGPTAAERSAVFSASMPRIKGAERMELRFDFLQRRPGDDDFVRLEVPKIGAWERAQPRVLAYVVEKRVNALAAPAAYRVRVRFRWLGADGHVLKHSERRSPICTQLDPRPDLVFEKVTTKATADPRQARYDVLVRNRGRGETIASAGVTLAVGGDRVPSQIVSPLAPGAAETVFFFGPRCSGDTKLELTLDPGGVVEEAGESNNVLSLSCAATLG